MIEIWINLDNDAQRGDTVIAVSNTGLMKCKNGKIKEIPLRRAIYVNGKLIFIYRILAKAFIPNPDNKPFVDHITHDRTKIDYPLNDIRNLRWCTNKENCNFEEAIENKRNAKLGTTLTEEHKNNISKSLKGKDYLKYWQGKEFTEEHRKKLSEAHKRENLSAETRRKLSESVKRGWIKRKARKKS